MTYLILLAALLLIVSINAANVTLTLLKHAPHARCLDGSPAGYYFQNMRSKKWVIYLNGGGECDNENGCKQQTTNALGSSKFFPEAYDASWWYLASDNCFINRDFCSWNHVFDPYCSQDLHSGQMTEPSEQTWGLTFAGHHILNAILDDMDQHGMKHAEEIILSGASAGGIGVWINLDYVAKRYPNARVRGLSIGGFYFPATFYQGPDARVWTGQGTMADFRESAWPVTYELYQAYVNEDCKAHYSSLGQSPGPCLIANNSVSFVQTPVFVVQSQTDEVVMQWHDMLPDVPSLPTVQPEESAFMREWHLNMTVALTAPERAKTIAGYFTAACWTHCNFNSQYPLIDGLNWYQAFGNYYFNRTPSSYHMDQCGEMCNPTCVNDP
jgi:hypothetical protein